MERPISNYSSCFRALVVVKKLPTHWPNRLYVASRFKKSITREGRAVSQTIDKTEGHGERDGTTPRTALAPVRQRGLAHRIRHRWFYWLRFVGNNGTGLGAIIAAIALPIAGLWSLYAY